MTIADAPPTNQPRDAVSGLGDSLAFLSQLAGAISQGALQGRPVAMLQLDIDHLDALNARLGQERGNLILLRAATILRTIATQHPSATGPLPAEAFRIGEDEFVLLLPETGRLQARRVAATVLAAARRENFTVSIGIGVADPGATDLGVLLLSADGALRAVKERGGGRARLLTTPPADAVGAQAVVEWLTHHTFEAIQRLDEFYQLALTDPVSGLPNQRALAQFLQAEIPRAQRHEHAFAVLLIDGDNLKNFNEQYGYAEGDNWIRRLGQLLTRETRASDLVVRWRSGDEFVVALPETSREAAIQVAERIRQAVQEEPIPLVTSATISIGVVAYPEDGEDADTLLDRAEEAVQIAKSGGKNQVAVPPARD